MNLTALTAKLSANEVESVAIHKGDKPFRITTGAVFCQPISALSKVKSPTGKGVVSQYTNKPEDYKWNQCYIGFSDDEGRFVTGFNMSVKGVIEALANKVLGDSVAKAFENYVNKCADANGQTYVKF